MEINLQNLDALFLGFNQAFQKGFTKPPSFFERICTVVPSSKRQEMYPWMGRSTKFREWMGDRAIQAIERHGYTITNRDYEDTVGVDRNDIEDDTWGTLSPLFEQLGWDAAVHPDTLIATMLTNAINNIDNPSAAGAVVSYDGKTLFSATGHPAGLAGGAVTNYPNCDAGGSGSFWYLLDISRPLKTLIFQRRKPYAFTRMNTEQDEKVFMARLFRYGVDARVNVGCGFWQFGFASNQDLSNSINYSNALAKLQQIKTDAGLPFGAGSMRGPGNLVLMVPPSLEETARRLLFADLVAGGAGGRGTTTGPQSNIWKNSAELMVNSYLS